MRGIYFSPYILLVSFFVLAWPFLGRAQEDSTRGQFLIPSTHPLSITLDENSFESVFGANIYRYVGVYNKNRKIRAYPGAKHGRLINYYNRFRYGVVHRLEMRLGANYYQKTFWNQDGELLDLPDDLGFSWLMGGGRLSLYQSAKKSLAFDLEVRQFLENRIYGNIKEGNDGLFLRVAGVASSILIGEWYLTSDLGVSVSQKDRGMEFDFDISTRWTQGAFALGAGVEGAVSLKAQSRELSSPLGSYTFSKGSDLAFESDDGESQYFRYYGALDLLLGRGWHLEFTAGQIFWGRSWPYEGFGKFNLVYRKSNWNFLRKKRKESFKVYQYQAKVIKVSPKGSLIKIDAGLSKGITKGMSLDIYQEDHLDKRVLVASGKVYQSDADIAIIKILKVYREDIPLAVGFIVRGSSQ